MMKLTRTVFGISAAITAGLLTATGASAATMVGTELLLSVDVSGSVDNNEFDLQREGYATAFESADVINAIENSPNGIAVALSYWSSNDTALEIGWTQLTTAADSQAFADTVRNAARNSSGGTNIPDAINFGVDSILNNDFNGSNLVIDVSGDGDNTNAFLTREARDAAVAAGITINGLAINGFGTDIEDFYRENVIGGPGSFVEPVNSFADVSIAAERKITREVNNGNGGGDNGDNPATTPEPASILGLFAMGALGIVKRKKSS